MSIDSLINDKKDAMQLGGQPLNQGVGPDLIEVLATRKLLEEKATIARDLALKQQPIPNTIAEQQDQKLLGLTQKEIATQTGGILANRNPQQGRPQPRPQQGGIMGAMGGGNPPMPQGAPRPPMGGAPRPPMGGAPRPPMGGIAGAAPRPPMMASGGIVGYNVGGKVKSAEEAVRALGLVDDPTSPAHQAKLQKIMQTLTAQSSPEEKDAVQKVLVDAGLKTGPVDKVRSGAYADDDYVFPKDRKGKDTSAAGFYGDLFNFSTGLPKDADREEAKRSPASGEQVSEEKLKELGMARAQYDALPEATKKMLNPKQAPKLGKTREERTAERLQGQKDIKAGQQAFNQRLADNKRTQARATAEAAGLQIADPITTSPAERTDTPLMGKKPEARPEFSFDPNTAGIAGAVNQGGPQGGAPQTPMGGGKPPMPQAGAGKEFDLSVDPSEFSSTSVSDSMNPQMKKQLDRRLALDPKTAADEERTAAMERYKVDDTTSGLQDILDRQLAESRRVADDPQAKYKRDKASIYAARAGAPGRAYQQRVLAEQGKEGKLLQQEANNFATMANTEAALITKVDAEAGKAATLAANALSEAMKVAATYDAGNWEAFNTMITQRGQQLKDEAALKLKREHNIALNEIQTMQQIVAASNAMSSIIAAELTQLQNSQKYMAEGSEGRAKLEKELNMEQNIKYIYPQQELIKRISKGFDIDVGDPSGSGGSELPLTDEEAAAMAQ